MMAWWVFLKRDILVRTTDSQLFFAKKKKKVRFRNQKDVLKGSSYIFVFREVILNTYDLIHSLRLSG